MGRSLTFLPAFPTKVNRGRLLLQEFLLALPMLLFALVAHEVAHGWAALKQGDNTAFMLGRLTLNPIPHIDPFMTVILPALLWFSTHGAFTFGGAKPVPVNPRNYRNFVKGDLIVSSAGVVTNFVLAICCTLLFILAGLIHNWTGGLGTATVTVAQRMLNWGIFLNILLGVFNLIPIPPLDGSRIFYHLLPPGWGARYRQLDRFGFLILLGLLFFFRGIFNVLLIPAWWSYNGLIHLASSFAIGMNWNIFS